MLGRDDKGPRGILSNPRNSTVIPQILRRSQRLVRAQNFTTATIAPRGISMVGMTASI